MRYLKFQIVASLLLSTVFATTLHGQSVRMVLQADSVYVGEPFRISLVATYPAAADLILPEATPDGPATVGDFELRRLIDRDVRPSYSGETRDSLVFEATTFAIDTARVDDGVVRFLMHGDTIDVVPTGAPLKVASTYVEGSEPRDIAPIVDFPPVLWPWIAGVLALIFGGYLAVRALRRRRLETDLEQPAALSAYDEAMLRLKSLEDHAVRSAEDRKSFAVELADILRTYLYRRLDIPARERTTREIVSDLEETDTPQRQLGVARDVLDLSDRIKFARAEASTKILLDARRDAAIWIEEMERSLQHDTPSASASSIPTE